MTLGYWCVLVAGLLPYAATLTAKIGGERFDNRNPREWLAAQSGFRRRANAAQLNSFEAFPLFAAAVIVAHVAGADQPRIDLLAVTFVAARIAYIACYVADLALLRSLAWFVGIGSAVALFFAAA
ncbi:MAG: MAPEG family protein [Steroidobacteraceae bacterium]